MPNYQNNMRYGRQGNMRRPCGQNAGYGRTQAMPQSESRCCTPDSMTRADMMSGREDSCCTAVPKTEESFCSVNESAERRAREDSRSCECRREDSLYGMPLAMAYVPWQTWGEIFDLCDGFQTGTIFKDLDKPFLGRGGWKR